VPSLDRIALAQLPDYEHADTPAVIAGGARDWPAMRWTPESLKQRLGGVEIAFKHSPDGVHPNFHAKALAEMFATKRARFADFIDSITTGPVPRWHSLFTGDERPVLRRRDGLTSIDDALGPLLDDVVTPEPARENLYTIWAWFSGAGVHTWLHYDNNGCHNLNAQLTGTKDCLLWAPDQLARLAPFPLGGDNPAYNCSQLDFRRGIAADHLTARLEPGDLLFIPAWWFHAFVHLADFNSNVNFWWKPARPRWNPVAARQALVDAATSTGLARDPDAAALLHTLDRALTAK
jgi:lysine-specific demethylase 8